MMPLPPGPTGSSLVTLARWIWSPLPLLDECAKKYGEYFTVRIPGMPPNVVFSDPRAVKDMFTADPDDVRLGELSNLLKPVMGENSVMLLDGPRHRRQRKLMLPPFHGERMRAYGALMLRETRDAVDRWNVNQPFPLVDEMHSITLEVILHTIIGVGDPAQLSAMRDTVTTFLKLGTSPLATALLLATPTSQVETLIYRSIDPIRVGPMRLNLAPVIPWRNVVEAQRRMDAMLYSEIAARRAQPSLEGRQDVLSLLMSAKDEQGNGLTDVELRDEIITLLLAGHETTATTLAWAVFHLLKTPSALTRLQQELAAISKDGVLEPEVLTKSEYLDAVLRETMRLSPVALIVGRRLMAPMRLGKWDLPAGVNALGCLYLTQRREDLWERPNDFVPERWIGSKIDAYNFFPFGGGARRCLGMAFAYYEMKIVLGEMIHRASLRFADDKPIRVQRKSITFAPSRGLPVIMNRRNSA